MTLSSRAPIVVSVENLQKSLSLDAASVENVIRRVLKIKKVSRAELTCVFVSRQKIAALNRRFLGRTYATDVLAFDLRQPGEDVLRGDVIVSTDAVIKQSRQFGQKVPDELLLYVVHGILHLLGYDDHSPKDIAAMRAEEQRILSILGLF